jgi:hypothetical protein
MDSKGVSVEVGQHTEMLDRLRGDHTLSAIPPLQERKTVN